MLALIHGAWNSGLLSPPVSSYKVRKTNDIEVGLSVIITQSKECRMWAFPGPAASQNNTDSIEL